MLPDAAKDRLREALAEIRSGRFTTEWGKEQAAGYPNFQRLRQEAREHDINQAEQLGREMLQRVGHEDAS
jgi:ketol-acid reductoisomerase